MMLDIHCHVLPGIDDGAQTTEEAFAILRMLKDQHVDAVIATPHFYSDRNTVEKFVESRNKAYEKISMHEEFSCLPPLFLGGEIRYYKGISDAAELELLTLGKSKYLLLEPPFMALSAYLIDEVQDLYLNRNITPIVAHVDRYLQFDHWEHVIELFRYGNVLGQVNASSLAGPFSGKKSMALLSGGYCQFIGSDAHNTNKRKPEMGKALVKVARICGNQVMQTIDENNHHLLASMELPHNNCNILL